VLVDEEPLHDNMPRTVEEATIAVIEDDVEVTESEIDAEYNVSNVDQLNAAIDAEAEELEGYAEAVIDVGADVVFTTGDIADRVGSRLAKAGVLAFESVGDDDITAIVGATGAHRAGSVGTLEASDLGSADSVSVESYDDDVTFIRGGADAEAVTIFARGGTEHVTDELERALEDAIDVVVAALDEGGVVPGAGATEIAIADHVRDHAASVEGRKQLSVDAFADAVDVLPRTLAENTGMDPIDALVDLRSAHEREGIAPHQRGPDRRRRRPDRPWRPRPRRGQTRGRQERDRRGDDDRPHRRRHLLGLIETPPRTLLVSSTAVLEWPTTRGAPGRRRRRRRPRRRVPGSPRVRRCRDCRQ
jgi:chaperonin GroEL (HSP60 family)